jgi:hypothetical protein
MNKLLGLVLILLLLLIYISLQNKSAYSSLRETPKNTTTIYNNIDQGYFEKTMFEFSYYSGINLDFNIFENHPGYYSPLVGISIYNQSRDSYLSLRYINKDNNEHLSLLASINSEIDMDEVIGLSHKIKSMRLTWDDNNVYIKADEFDYVMNIPFEPSLIAVTNSSIEVLNSITFIEKKDNE